MSIAFLRVRSPAARGRWLAAVLASLPAIAAAQVVTDGTLGARQTFNGQAVTLPAALGQQRGGNLFHSFGQFDIPAGGRVTFAGPSNVANVIARVTGNAPSRINGTIANSIAGANTLLINPHGFVFGAGTALDVTGSFAATTADVLHFTDGGRFNAALAAGDDVLTTASVSSFGFLSNAPAPITATSASLFTLGGSRAISLVGGDIAINQSGVGGAQRVNLIARRNAGEVTLDPASIPAPANAPATGRGNIAIAGSTISAFGDGAGRIDIRAADLSLSSKSAIVVSNTGAAPPFAGAGIDIDLAGTLRSNESVVATRNADAGAGAPAHITAKAVFLDGDGIPDNGSIGILNTALAEATGRAGDLDIRAGTLRIRRGAEITSNALGTAAGGAIGIVADNAFLDGVDTTSIFTGIAAITSLTDAGGGRAGDLDLKFDRLEIANAAQINANAFGSGNGGVTRITANTAVFDGTRLNASNLTGITTQSLGAGDSGPLNLRFDSLTLRGGAIAANARGSGNGGEINVVARAMVLDGRQSPGFNNLTGLSAQTFSTSADAGRGGSVNVRADSLTMLNGAIAVNTNGAGEGGQVTVRAGTAIIDGKGGSNFDLTGIFAQSNGVATGKPGSMDLNFGHLEVIRGARITTQTDSTAAGGSIRLTADSALLDGTDSELVGGITASTRSPALNAGPGGTLDLHFGKLVIRDGAQIFATSLGRGAGGTIRLVAEQALIENVDAVADFETGIIAQTRLADAAAGDAGSLDLQFGKLTLRHGGQISSDTLGNGAAGSVRVRADQAVLDGANRQNVTTGISSATLKTTSGGGDAGSLDVDFGTLAMRRGATIDVTSFGPGDAGSIAIRADRISIDNSGVFAQAIEPTFTASAGSVQVTAGDIELLPGAAISATNFGSGPAGAVDLRVRTLRSAGTISSVASQFGTAGGVTLLASDAVSLSRGAVVSARAESGNAGQLTLRAGRLIDLRGANVGVETSAIGGNLTLDAGSLFIRDSLINANAGEQGNLFLNAGDTVLIDHSTITATAQNVGGQITIDPLFVVLQASVINGTSGGTPVRVTIDPTSTFIQSTDSQIIADNPTLPPDNDVAGALTSFHFELLGQSTNLMPTCATLSSEADAMSTFTVQGREGVPGSSWR